MNFYDFHIGDYASRTGHLEPMEDLAYRRMLDLYYLREGALPSDPGEVAKLIRMRSEVRIVEAILGEFFTLTEDGWEQAKCEERIAEAQDKREKAKASANAGWIKRKSERTANAQRTHSEGKADAERPDSEGNAPNPTTQSHSQKNPPKPPKGGEPAGFEEFYAAYPKKQGRVAAVKAFEKVSVGLPVLLDALAWQREQEAWTKDGGKFVPLPATWLNGRRWEDQRPTVGDEPDWRQSRSGVERRARQLGLAAWDECEQWPLYVRRVVEADRGKADGGFLSLDKLVHMDPRKVA